MNNLILTLCFMLANQLVMDAQPAKSMDTFKSWEGQWSGKGTMNRDGQQQTFYVSETIKSKLDGNILTVEGIGKDSPDQNGNVVHHAFAVLNYDSSSGSYQFRSYLADGKSTNAWFNVTGNSKYQWGFDVATGKIRYTIDIAPNAKTWDELGEYSPDGKRWFQFMTMHLTKVE